ncbi:phosphotransferase [Desulfovibrio sp. JC022]|uniref:phosphotransferase n=1 Tax=Desulfovibrio sp. JC022 TaxID=2593642 RepID=UPI0013D8251D|nr:phosphotransferase [Desulfovibrio sp. JC022]NDV23226.1 phosphotransferase [Desulfovibrio sp. JC022]
MVDSDPKRLVRNLTGEIPVNAKRICAGRNSRVFRVDCESGRTLLAKFYLQPTADGHSRLEQEWTALQFINESGLRNIPRPLGFDETVQGTVYSFIHGTPEKKATDENIRAILAFLAKLKDFSTQDNAAVLPRAAEACFSPAELVENIKLRFDKLRKLPAQDELYQLMHSFLVNEFTPRFKKSIIKAEQKFPGCLWTKPLQQHYKTLSPSDFGFHNMIKSDTSFTFVDFEYFGWDDPVKSTSDFLLHPAMNLSESQMVLFFSGMENIFKNDKQFIVRFKTYLPLFRLKWCMILLNEFLNQHLQRREFAAGDISDRNDLRADQLDKAENFLNKDQKILTALNLRN